MKANEARKVTKQAELLQAAKRAAEQRAEDARIERENAKYLRDEYPKFEAEVYRDIRKTAKSGGKSISVTPKGIAWQKLEPKLREDGYHIQAHFVPGEYENMGDFNAPCNVWVPAYWWYSVSW